MPRNVGGRPHSDGRICNCVEGFTFRRPQKRKSPPRLLATGHPPPQALGLRVGVLDYKFFTCARRAAAIRWRMYFSAQPPSPPRSRLNSLFCHATDGIDMSVHTQVPEEWRHWIAHNLQRDCDLEMLVADMVRAGFDTDAARTAVFDLAGRSVAAAAV